MASHRDFTHGPVGRQILSMAIPIMGVAFLQMAYNLTDMYWIGQLGSREMTAVGASGIFVWFATAISLIPKTGTEVLISQCLGRGQLNLAQRYARHTVVLSLGLGLLLGLAFHLFHGPLLRLVGFQEETTLRHACSYSRIVALGFPFIFLINGYYGLYNGYGKPRPAFWANGIGLLLNMVLDPLLIHGLGPIPAMGVEGGGLATVIAQGCVVGVFLLLRYQRECPFQHLLRGFRPHGRLIDHLLRTGAPPGLQSALFSIIALTIARIVAGWGDIEVAVQTLGAQIEAITWMTAAGFSTALTAFTGQNYGAGNRARVLEGYRVTLRYLTILSLLVSLLFVFRGEALFALFSKGDEVRVAGGRYMRIIGLTQFFMVLEITTAGLLNGLGKTHIPARVGILFNLLRIPLALWWGYYSVQGVWWSLSLSSLLKGVTIWGWLRLVERKRGWLKA